jgi:hypothetical protein
LQLCWRQEKEKAEAKPRKLQAEEEALNPEQSTGNSVRAKRQKRKSGNQMARNQRRLAKKRQLENDGTFEVWKIILTLKNNY